MESFPFYSTIGAAASKGQFVCGTLLDAGSPVPMRLSGQDRSRLAPSRP
jgi:hypothetical protein